MADQIKIENMREYHKNPRKISEDRFDKLGDSLTSLGDLGGIVLNARTNEIIGGNQRVKTFLTERERYTIELSEEFSPAKKDGTTAVGFIIKDKGQESEQRFSFRVVDWDEEKAERANIQANKVTGVWDYDVLGNQFDVEKLLDYGFTKIDLDLLPKPPEVPKGGGDEGGGGGSGAPSDNIKQMVFYFKDEDFDNVTRRLDRAMESLGAESHTDAFLKLLEYFEKDNIE